MGKLEKDDSITETRMWDIFIEASDLGLMVNNSFRLRMNPRLIASLSEHTCCLVQNGYVYPISEIRIIADSSVGTYKIEKP